MGSRAAPLPALGTFLPFDVAGYEGEGRGRGHCEGAQWGPGVTHLENGHAAGFLFFSSDLFLVFS